MYASLSIRMIDVVGYYESTMNCFAVRIFVWHVANFSFDLNAIMFLQCISVHIESRLIIHDYFIEFGHNQPGYLTFTSIREKLIDKYLSEHKT